MNPALQRNALQLGAFTDGNHIYGGRHVSKHSTVLNETSQADLGNVVSPLVFPGGKGRSRCGLNHGLAYDRVFPRIARLHFK